VLEAAPAEIAIARETWFRSEATADEKRLKAAQRVQSAAASELTELEANLVTVDRLLGEELAREQQAARERLTARLSELRAEQTEAFAKCGEAFVELYEAWRNLAASQEALQSTWWVSPGREGFQPGHLLDPTPVTFEAMLGVLYRAALKRNDVDYQVLERVTHLVPDLGRDTPLELGGQGVQPLRGF
jgi:hypothetical protein